MVEQIEGFDKADTDAMKSLVHNELGFMALCKYLSALRNVENKRFIELAQATVFNLERRESALHAAGRVKALETLYSIFKGFIEEGE